MTQLSNFWSVLFDAEDATCFGSHAKETRIGSQLPDSVFFSINALYRNKDLEVTRIWHHALIGRRADANVTKYRSFLLEIDNMPLDEQRAYIDSSGVPWSTCTYSGKKSLHFIIALERPLANRAEYDAVVRRLYKALPTVDPSAKNPSRFSRVPGAHRPDTGNQQELLEVRPRVPNEVLIAWLDEKAPEPKTEPTRTGPKRNGMRSLKVLPSTHRFLMEGAPDGQWDTPLFNAACNLCRLGYTIEQTAGFVLNVAHYGYLTPRDVKTIESAYRTVLREIRSGT